MPKLQTPVLYEDSLDGLNEVRPLSIGDKVEQSIELPVVNAMSVNTGRIADGRLLRCDNNGSLLRGNRSAFENGEVKEVTLTREDYPLAVVFPQIVNYVVLYGISGAIPEALLWHNSDATITFLYEDPFTIVFLEFTGKTIYISGYRAGPWTAVLGCEFSYRR